MQDPTGYDNIILIIIIRGALTYDELLSIPKCFFIAKELYVTKTKEGKTYH